jgi:hypothetical protein
MSGGRIHHARDEMHAALAPQCMLIERKSQAPPHGSEPHGGSVASPRKRQKLELLEGKPLTPFFFGAHEC